MTTPTNGNGAAREALILGQMPLAAWLADREHRHLPPWIGLDEARSVAYLALVQAVDRWDSRRGVPLGAWVREPIRGAVRDLGRRKAARLAWVPEACGGEAKRGKSDGSAPSGHGADAMEGTPAPEPSPESIAAYRQFQDTLWRAVERLPVRLQLVVRLRYCAGLSNADIGRLLRVEVRGPRVSQLHAKAIKMLRESGRDAEQTEAPAGRGRRGHDRL